MPTDHSKSQQLVSHKYCQELNLQDGQRDCPYQFAKPRNVAEMYVGVERSTDPAREAEKIEHLIEGLEILEFDDASARIFGAVTARLQNTRTAGRRHGCPDRIGGHRQ